MFCRFHMYIIKAWLVVICKITHMVSSSCNLSTLLNMDLFIRLIFRRTTTRSPLICLCYAFQLVEDYFSVFYSTVYPGISFWSGTFPKYIHARSNVIHEILHISRFSIFFFLFWLLLISTCLHDFEFRVYLFMVCGYTNLTAKNSFYVYLA
jgi:hypothetical protein